MSSIIRGFLIVCVTIVGSRVAAGQAPLSFPPEVGRTPEIVDRVDKNLTLRPSDEILSRRDLLSKLGLLENLKDLENARSGANRARPPGKAVGQPDPKSVGGDADVPRSLPLPQVFPGTSARIRTSLRPYTFAPGATRQVLAAGAIDPRSPEIAAAFNTADLNKDGKVTLQEIYNTLDFPSGETEVASNEADGGTPSRISPDPVRPPASPTATDAREKGADPGGIADLRKLAGLLKADGVDFLKMDKKALGEELSALADRLQTERDELIKATREQAFREVMESVKAVKP